MGCDAHMHAFVSEKMGWDGIGWDRIKVFMYYMIGYIELNHTIIPEDKIGKIDRTNNVNHTHSDKWNKWV